MKLDPQWAVQARQNAEVTRSFREGKEEDVLKAPWFTLATSKNAKFRWSRVLPIVFPPSHPDVDYSGVVGTLYFFERRRAR